MILKETVLIDDNGQIKVVTDLDSLLQIFSVEEMLTSRDAFLRKLAQGLLEQANA